MCRGAALDLSSLKPVLDENNVRLVGVGLEYFGVEDFVEGKFWGAENDCELFVDKGKKLYKQLQLTVAPITSVISAKVRVARKKYGKTPGNLKGDGLQLGATYVVDKGGVVLMEYRQKHFGDHPPNNMVLEALGINSPGTAAAEAEGDVAAAINKSVDTTSTGCGESEAKAKETTTT